MVHASSDLEEAKVFLNKFGPLSRSRMIREVRDGAPQRDPHTISGQSQGSGSAASFKKWRQDWNDIHRMTAAVEGFIALAESEH